MKKTRTKIIGGLMVAILFATIGAVLVSAETDDAEDSEDWHLPIHRERNMFGLKIPKNELTEDQQSEIDSLITILSEDGASCEEIREAIFDKLDEMGIIDEHLDDAIEQTEQRLMILNRENELRDEGYSWEEINEIIQDEFVLDNYNNSIINSYNREICFNNINSNA